MFCDFCKKPCLGGIAFKLMEQIDGTSSRSRKACFPCIQEIGERIMNPRPPQPEPPKDRQ